ncbi:MAG: shikimate dehydrogenase [Clostridia bacterium]|nr:shikimate dehydrogenase [Clostridia bacterium]
MQYGLIGTPLGHSHSPYVHSFFGYEYVLRPVEREDLAGFIAEGDYKGLNVTIPHKTAVIPYLDELDDSAKACGAVNTIVNRAGKKVGYNTDIFGMEYALRSAKIDLSDKNVIVLGSGGTSHMAQTLAKKSGAKSVTVVSRSGETNYEKVYDLDVEVVLNCTPVGMYPNNGQRLLDLDRLPHLVGVFDAVYNPIKTALVLDAEERGIAACGGLKMLVAQAKRAAEIFTDQTYDDAMIEKISERLRKKLCSIVLIGMPGSGKTTVGRKVAELTHRDFFDLDTEIERQEGRKIPDIFSESGEAYFRAVEKRILADLTKKQGVVLSTGGGAVIDHDNIRAMRQNGILFRINRDPNTLPRDGRPLSKDPETVQKLAQEREKFYALADYSVKNDYPSVCAQKIVELYAKK